MLASCTIGASSPTKSSRLQHEASACRRIAPPPRPVAGTSSSITIAVRGSLLTALTKSGNVSLEHIARELKTAARKDDSEAMSQALSRGVTVCHRLGLRTAK